MVRCIVAKRAILSAVAGMFSISVLMSAPSVLAAGTSTQALEAQIKLLEEQLQSIRGELDRVKSDTVRNEQKIQQNEQSVASVRAQSNAEEKDKHMVFFRGGFAHSNNLRNGVSIQSNVAPVGAQDQAGKDAWYIGAGFDFNLTNDVWGFLPGTSVFAELMFEYKQFSNGVLGNALANNPTQLANGALNPRKVTVSQFTLTAAPKIKFLEGSRFRPWIIPAGLALHVISPPSESITVLQPGVMFGVGADYNIWKAIYVGADARYQLAGGKIDGVNVNGFTVGGYLGIGF
ncbi:porin family protein [Nitrosomonas sp.]|uniref:porin family protein n=1 Tax=Nitrosomonas sp. TaxID=42353 RepID=UPI0025CF8613|nr:porin family protein [Nitrosomonas sp.]MCC6917068.1 porin family protein [Nitrosomonas sp.]